VGQVNQVVLDHLYVLAFLEALFHHEALALL